MKPMRKPGTVRDNISALRLLVRTVHPGKDPDTQNRAVLSGELIRQFERRRMASARRAGTTTHSRVNSQLLCSSSFNRRSAKNAFLDDLILPELTSFQNERVEMPKRTKPRALDVGVIAVINAAAPKLATSDPAVYVAFLLFSRLGLRTTSTDSISVAGSRISIAPAQPIAA
jgi:hypothetical protein